MQVDGDEAGPSSSQLGKSLGGGLDEWGTWPGTGMAAVELRQEPAMRASA